MMSQHPYCPFGPEPNFDSIPPEIQTGYWCVWKASPKTNKPGKFDKKPSNGSNDHLSTKALDEWLTYDQAKQLYLSAPGTYNGVGRLADNLLVYIDVDNESMRTWQEWVDQWPTYCEISPSGNGLHFFSLGQVSRDAYAPVEVYNGHAARFITITGNVCSSSNQVADLSQRIEDEIISMAPAAAEVIDIDMPAIIQPAIGFTPVTFSQGCQDRSDEMLGVIHRLLNLEPDHGKALGLLYDSPETWSYALDHRDGRPDRAIQFLWREMKAALGSRSESPFQNIAQVGQPGAPQILAAPGRRLKTVQASTITPVDIDWMWEGFLVQGKINLIAGNPGVSKSLLTCTLAAHVTTGTPWPDGSPCQQGSFVILNAEDDGDDTMVPRLIAAGADLSKVYIVHSTVDEHSGLDERVFSLRSDIAQLRQLAVDLGDQRVLSIDPLNSYMGGETNINKDNEVRAILTPLQLMASEMKICTIGVAHLNKDMGKDAIYRIMGSMGFTGLARSVWGVIKDKHDDDRRLIVPIKANLSQDGEGLAYRVSTRAVANLKREQPYVVFEAERHSLTAEDTMHVDGDRDTPAKTAAAEFIEEVLAPGPLRSADFEARLADAGHSTATISRARKALKVMSRKAGEVWWVCLPKDGAILMHSTEEQLEGGPPDVPDFLR